MTGGDKKADFLCAVLRFRCAGAVQNDLEKRLGAAFDRYEADSKYAQLGVGEAWDSIARVLETHGDTIRSMLQDKHFETASLDIAISFYSDKVALTRRIPNHILQLAAGSGIDVDVSVYLTARDDR